MDWLFDFEEDEERKNREEEERRKSDAKDSLFNNFSVVFEYMLHTFIRIKKKVTLFPLKILFTTEKYFCHRRDVKIFRSKISRILLTGYH